MFNLLPENLRNRIKKEYRFRLAIVVLLFIILSQISFIIFLFPSWLISFYKEKDFMVKSDEISKTISALDVASTTSFIRTLNEKLLNISDAMEYPLIIPIYNSILSVRSSSIRLGSMYYTATDSNSAVVTISGISDKRDSLVSFTESLRKIESFSSVDLPISNLAKDKNIDFTISINIEK